MEELYHIVKNRHVFDDKWGKIARHLSIPSLIPQGIHSSMMCFAGMNSGKINEEIFRYILFGYGFFDKYNDFLNVFIKFKVLDKNFNLISWNKHQKSIIHNKTLTVENSLSKVDKVDKMVEYKLSLIEDGVEYLVDKKVDPKLYQAWYFQRSKKGLSCKASYDILTSKGYVVKTRSQPTNLVELVESVVEKVELVDKKVETPQRTRVERREEKRREEEKPLTPSSKDFVCEVSQKPSTINSTETFERIFQKYPTDANKSKAFMEWNELLLAVDRMELDETLRAIEEGVDRYSCYCKHNKLDLTYTLHFATFLKDKRWSDGWQVEANKKVQDPPTAPPVVRQFDESDIQILNKRNIVNKMFKIFELCGLSEDGVCVVRVANSQSSFQQHSTLMKMFREFNLINKYKITDIFFIK